MRQRRRPRMLLKPAITSCALLAIIKMRKRLVKVSVKPFSPSSSASSSAKVSVKTKLWNTLGRRGILAGWSAYCVMAVCNRADDWAPNTLVSEILFLINLQEISNSYSEAGLIEHIIRAQFTYPCVFVLRYSLSTYEDLHSLPTSYNRSDVPVPACKHTAWKFKNQ